MGSGAEPNQTRDSVNERPEESLALLPEGQLLRVNDWGPNGIWVMCIFIALMALLSALNWLSEGGGLWLNTLIYLMFALLLWRVARAGLIVDPDGIKARLLGRDHRFVWSQIESFELRGTLYSPNLRIRLRDGKAYGVVGLAGRTVKEKEQASQILEALNQRLAEKNGLPHAPPPPGHARRSVLGTLRDSLTIRE